jgi:hypothetical protein
MSATWQKLNNLHKTEKGWNCAGYNEYIRYNGDVFILRGDNEGAHTLGYNGVAYGIACEGDYEQLQTMPQVQYSVLVERIKYHRNRFSRKNVVVVPHSQLVATSCPGKYFPMTKLLAAIDRQENIDDGFDGIIDVLASYTTSDDKPLLDAAYWKHNAQVGKMVKGEYAREVIKRLFEKIPM